MKIVGLVVLMCCAALPAHAEITVAADAPMIQPTTSDLFSSNAWGSRGGFHLQAARPIRKGSLAITIGDSYTSANSMFVMDDSDTQSTLSIRALWSPWENLELGLGQIAVVNKYTNIVGTSFQVLGNPTLFAKYSAPMSDVFGLGGVFQLTVPTSQLGNGLEADALTLRFTGIASYRVNPYLDLTANLGYVYDRSSALFNTVDPVESYVFEIWSASNRASYGLGAVSEFVVSDMVGVSPFAEFWGQYTGSLAMAHNPLAVTLGLKAFPTESRIVQGVVGVDLRLAGEPHGNVPAPGLPPWLFFAQVDFHFGETVQPANLVSVTRCTDDGECGAEHVCESNACVRVIRQEVVKEAAKTPTVALEGVVLDAESGQPVAGAEVSVNKAPNTITVNGTTGRFDVCPMPADGGVTSLKARALGYVDEEVVAPRSATPGANAVVIHMRPTGSRITGVFKGSVRDSATGKPVDGVSIYVPAASLKVTPEADGTFDVTLTVGRYQILVSAPNYQTQKKEILITNDQIVISNIDLVSKTKPKEDKGKRK